MLSKYPITIFVDRLACSPCECGCACACAQNVEVELPSSTSTSFEAKHVNVDERFCRFRCLFSFTLQRSIVDFGIVFRQMG